jgi:hypothetical protein
MPIITNPPSNNLVGVSVGDTWYQQQTTITHENCAGEAMNEALDYYQRPEPRPVKIPYKVIEICQDSKGNDVPVMCPVICIDGGTTGGGTTTTTSQDGEWVEDADNPGDYYWVVTDSDGSVTYYDAPGGTSQPAPANVRPILSVAIDKESLKCYKAVNAGTGYAVGDELRLFVFTDLSSNPPVVAGYQWLNVTQQTQLTTSN